PPGSGLGNRDQAAGGAHLVRDNAGVHQRGRDRVSGGEPEARRITAAYTLRSSTPLDFTFSGWLEATNASFEGTMMGSTAPRGHKPRMDPTGSGTWPPLLAWPSPSSTAVPGVSRSATSTTPRWRPPAGAT